MRGGLMSKRYFIVVSVFVGMIFPAWVMASNDPTQPPTVNNKVLKPAVKASPKRVVIEKKVANWILKSTLISSDRKTAVINDKVLSVGEKVDGAKLIKILPGKVKIRVKGRIKTLRLIKKDVKNNMRKVSHQSSRKNGQ